MDAHELLISWPGLDQLSSSSILSHPAWKMPIGYEDDAMSLTVNAASSTLAGELFLRIALDDAENILGISDSPSYPDLHRLWSRRAELPEALVIALVEKEVGTLLQAVEKLMNGELRLIGLSQDAGSVVSRRSFSLATPGGTLDFSLCVPSDVVSRIGVLDNIDPSHPAISSLMRNVRAEYAAVEVPSDSAVSLAPGDFIVLSTPEAAVWQMNVPVDEKLHIMSAEESSFSFAQFVTDALPAVPPPANLAVFHRGRHIATAVLSSVGDIQALKITTL